jgi:hypothetical protein
MFLEIEKKKKTKHESEEGEEIQCRPDQLEEVKMKEGGRRWYQGNVPGL